MKGAKVTSAIIDTGDSSEDRYGLLINPPMGPEYGNQWVLAPRLGNGRYDEIQEYVACFMDGTNCYTGESGIVTPTPIPSPRVTKASEKRK
jgi:hypothetical protein